MLLGQWSALSHLTSHAPAREVGAHSVNSDHGHDQDWGHQAATSTCELSDHVRTGQAPVSEHLAGLRLPAEASHIAAGAAPSSPGPIARAYEARGPPRA